jgi:hypothetical protein
MRLDRSLDEIFDKANDFKRLMIEEYHGLPLEPWLESIGHDVL